MPARTAERYERMELAVSDFIDIEDIIDGLAAAAWNRLTETPQLRSLAPVFLPPMRGTVRMFLNARLTEVRAAPHGGRLLTFRTPPGGTEALVVELAGQIVCSIEGALQEIRPLDLITAVIPAALLGFLEPILAVPPPPPGLGPVSLGNVEVNA